MFGTVFFICTMFFLAYVLLAGSPLERVNRGCLPAKWVGRAATSVAAIVSDGAEATMKESAGGIFQSCRFVVFRQFYAEELAEMRRRAGQSQAGTPAQKQPEGGK